MKTAIKRQQRISRAHRTHEKLKSGQHPRLIVFRSLRAIYAQIMDDAQGKVICGTSNLKGVSGIEGAKLVGKQIAELAEKNKIACVAFDKNGYQYHGQVKALAEAAREAGLKF